MVHFAHLIFGAFYIMPTGSGVIAGMVGLAHLKKLGMKLTNGVTTLHQFKENNK
jgi:hypothetical protein